MKEKTAKDKGWSRRLWQSIGNQHILGLEGELPWRGRQRRHVSRSQFLVHSKAKRCNGCRQKHSVHDELSANTIKMGTEIRNIILFFFHSCFLSMRKASLTF